MSSGRGLSLSRTPFWQVWHALYNGGLSPVSQYDARSRCVSITKKIKRSKKGFFWNLMWHFWLFSEFFKERKKREEERKKMMISLGKKSPKAGHQTTEQRNYQLKVKEMRNTKIKKEEKNANDTDSGGDQQELAKDRQPNLQGLVPDYDLKLFLEAQAVASEKIVSFHLMMLQTRDTLDMFILSKSPCLWSQILIFWEIVIKCHIICKHMVEIIGNLFIYFCKVRLMFEYVLKIYYFEVENFRANKLCIKRGKTREIWGFVQILKCSISIFLKKFSNFGKWIYKIFF